MLLSVLVPKGEISKMKPEAGFLEGLMTWSQYEGRQGRIKKWSK